MRASGRVTTAVDVLGGRIATEHLLRLGHRRIGFAGEEVPDGVGESLGFVSSARRLSGYRQALAAAGVRYDPDLVRRGPHGTATATLRQQLALAIAQRASSAPFPASDVPAREPEPPMFVTARKEPGRPVQPPEPLRCAGAEPVLEGR